jgi:hypothetical protein
MLAAVLLAASCGRQDSGPATVAYSPPDASFHARLPADWKADESLGETRKAAFFGPPDGAKPYSQLMGVYFHAAPDPESAARAYLAGSGPPAREIMVGSRRGLEVVSTRTEPAVEMGPQTVQIRSIAVPVAGGFFILEHTWPVGAAPSPAFDELVKTFEPAAAK